VLVSPRYPEEIMSDAPDTAPKAGEPPASGTPDPGGTPPRAGGSPKAGRDHAVNVVLWQVLFLNLLVAVLKLVFGSLSGALSMVADGFHSTLDASSNVVGLIGLRIARRAPDADHPYGHRKFEALAALGISLFLFITCYEILTSVASRFRGSHVVEPHLVTFATMIVTIAVNLFVTRYERREGNRLRSMILLADARHTQSDVFASLGVIASLVAAVLNFSMLDLLVAVSIAGFIAYSGYSIVSGAFSVLADSQMVDPDEVIRVATRVEGVAHAHRVRSRGLPDDIHVDLHLHVPPEMTVEQAHLLAHEASARIRNEIPGVTDVVIHVEPHDEHED
jgi:cation diffusion facilitator family transporter